MSLAPWEWSRNSISVRSASGVSGGEGTIGADRSTIRCIAASYSYDGQTLPPLCPGVRVPRPIKTSLAMLATVLVAGAASPAAEAAPTKQLLRQAKQALHDSPGAPTDLTPILKQLSVRLPGLEGSERREAQSLLARPTEGSADPQGNGYDVPEAAGSPD